MMASLIANSGKTDPKMWEAIGNIPKAYYEGQDQAYKQRMRNVFSDENGGLPRDKDGNVDFQKAYEQGFLNRIARLAYVGSLN
jgi:hypothetical protein